jgi:uncharacterized protein (DUF1697 family)
MADLRELLDGQGYKDVRTHLQSGNVVLSSTLSPRQLERTLERQLAEGFGFDISVLVRTRAELAKVVERNPLRKVATDGSRHVVSFLSRRLPAAVARELEAADVAPERVAISGREIYAWYPNGIQRSPLGKLLDDSRLGVVSTARNWNTVVKLLELASE